MWVYKLRINPEGKSSKDQAPLNVKEVTINSTRYIVCLNTKQARKDAQDRQALAESLREKIKKDLQAFIGNRGYRKYLKIKQDSVTMGQDKFEFDSRFDGKWVFKTNTDLPADQEALKHKELRQVKQAFRDVKSILEAKPVFHQRDENIRGHVSCVFLPSYSKKSWITTFIKRAIFLSGLTSNRI